MVSDVPNAQAEPALMRTPAGSINARSQTHSAYVPQRGTLTHRLVPLRAATVPESRRDRLSSSIALANHKIKLCL